MSQVREPATVGVLAREADAPRSPFETLADDIRTARCTVGVVGQGYVGFPLAQRAAACGFRTIGIDLDPCAVERARSLNTWDRYGCTSDLSALAECSVVMIAVPTPTATTPEGFAPDLGAVRAAAQVVGRFPPSRGARLVIVESTYAPGTTREVVAPLVGPGTSERPTAIAYSPERIDPGNDRFDVVNIPKLVAGLDEDASQLAAEFYGQIVERVVPASSVEAAEAAKLLENVFRFVNITFAQEFDEYCDRIGVSSREVVGLAATKPFGFMPFSAGAGIGGHCIAEDPYFLRAAMVGAGLAPPILEASIGNHENRAAVLAERIRRRLGGLTGRNILLLGVTYKPDVADTRRSPAGELVRVLEAAGAHVGFADPYVQAFAGMSSVDLDAARPGEVALAVVVTRHRAFDLDRMRAAGWALFDPADTSQSGAST
jgi:UDP-N-acetyl-D-glucosamine dehydrogenase